MQEIWKTVPRYPDCEVSNAGRVRYKAHIKPPIKGTTNGLHERTQHKNRGGYHSVNICGKKEFVHVLVIESFIGARPVGNVCDHINKNPADNNVKNLRWIPAGTNLKRSNVGSPVKFNTDKMQKIKDLYKQGFTQRVIAIKFNCSQGTISNVIRGKFAY